MRQRYRLRFLLQEFDLRGPEVVIGRSPECHITIEDPLVSRRHARIQIRDDDPPEVSDLGSRNGVLVNGVRIERPTPLSNGDRLRIGTQELVFYIPRKKKRTARTTGFMTVCESCRTPYPESAAICPHCGSSSRQDETMTGMQLEPQRAWTFQLLGEVIDRALETDRVQQAIRMMRRAAREIDERLTSGDHLQPEQLAVITSYALRLAEQGGDADWLNWSLNVHRQQNLFPDAAFVERLAALDLHALDGAPAMVRGFVTWARTERDTFQPPPPVEAVERLDELAARPSTLSP